MYYAFDTTDQDNAAMEAFLADYTGNVNPQFDYESKATYAAEFESFRSMFLLLGGVLSLIVGLVGVLNFFNAILTGIITRKREFAVLQSIGMTGRQLKTTLVYEGLLYAMGAVAAALVLTVGLSPLLGKALGSMFWFLTYRFTVVPICWWPRPFALLGVLVPLGCTAPPRGGPLWSVCGRRNREGDVFHTRCWPAARKRAAAVLLRAFER